MLDKEKSYSVKPENLNLDEYKNLLLNKLTDSLEIAGFKMDDLTSRMPKRLINSDVLRLSNNLQPTQDDYIKNFPFPNLREQQSYALNEIATAFASGYKYIVLEAPTGFGKSPVAIAVALTLGTSYICTSTKDLQAQYARDFPFVRVAKGKNNFICAVKDDFMRNGTYKCGLCVSEVKECYHTTADYGPCMRHESFKKRGCRYRTFLKHYRVNNKGTRQEEVFIDQHMTDCYQQEYSQWMHLKNLNEKREWRPCEYYHQLNIALASSHSILNYSIFLALQYNTPNIRIFLPARDLLILDEAHLLESEIVRFRGISISKRRWKRYIPNLKMVDYGYDDVEKWIDFLIELEARMLVITGNGSLVEELSTFRRERYNWTSKTDSFNKKQIGGASDIIESDEENDDEHLYTTHGEELAVEAIKDTEKLTEVIDNILSNPKNWIVSEIKKQGHEVIRVELKPLDVSSYFKDVFGQYGKILMMSATILDKDAFHTSLGLAPEEVKFIQVPSDFPLENRPINPLNVVYLNYESLHKDAVKRTIAEAIDRIMTQHKDHKGIIHTTSYEQLNFIKENVSRDNKRRLLETDPVIQRDEIIKEHINATKPTVLISPSLRLGLDLKDGLSRFQVITKVPYPSLGDRWINEKRKCNENWYTWQTALRLVQAYGRSVRSKEDWAKTYVLDSAFRPFVMRNKNILPHWFSQAIQPDPLKTSLGQGAIDAIKVTTPSQDHHNQITINHHNPTNEISFYIPSQQSGTLA
jgi:ATP-dependent DNA helicase DinG